MNLYITYRKNPLILLLQKCFDKICLIQKTKILRKLKLEGIKILK